MNVGNSELMNDFHRVYGKLCRRRQMRYIVPPGPGAGRGRGAGAGGYGQAGYSGPGRGNAAGRGLGMGPGLGAGPGAGFPPGRGVGCGLGPGLGLGIGRGGRHGQNRILAALAMQDGASQKDLAIKLGIRPQSLTLGLEALEADGLIIRRQDEFDRRTRRVYLTDLGRDVASNVAQYCRMYADTSLSMLSSEEKQQLSRILGKIDASLGDTGESLSTI